MFKFYRINLPPRIVFLVNQVKCHLLNYWSIGTTGTMPNVCYMFSSPLLGADVSVSDEPSFPTLVVLTADKLAGGPLREYLEKTQQDQALSSLRFWEDAQRYLSPSEDFGSYSKYQSAKTLIATYIAPGSPRQIEMSMRVRDDLMRLLPEEKGDHLLSSFVKKSVQVMLLLVLLGSVV